jgi:uncharacterized membrane protein
MSKFLKLFTSICLTTPLFVLIGTIGDQPSAHAWMKFCNKRNVAVQFAYSRKKDYVPDPNELYDYGGSHYTDIYEVRGWYTVNPGDCKTVSDLSASRDAADGQKGYFSITHYYHIRTASGKISLSAKENLCIRDDNQFITNTRVSYDPKKVKCSEGFYSTPFTKISPTKNNYTLNFTGTSNPPDPATCKQGYVWREAGANDRVCVTPEVRTQTRNENATAASHREPNGGPYGPDTCKQGYVWREATADDRVCVTPEVRTQAAEDNKRAGERRIS